jgi:hypothetical protein
LGGVHCLSELFRRGRHERRLRQVARGQSVGRGLGDDCAVLVAKFGAAGAPVIAVVVGATCCLMILGAHLPVLTVVSAQVYGYAATAGFALLTGGSALDFSLGKGPFTTVAISLIVGACFGHATGILAGKLVAKPA